jgi:hypothetical protein
MVIRGLQELRLFIEQEMDRTYIKEEITDSQPDKRLPNRFIVKAKAQYVATIDVPEEFLDAYRSFDISRQ